jgi:hypothetical protein
MGKMSNREIYFYLTGVLFGWFAGMGNYAMAGLVICGLFVWFVFWIKEQRHQAEVDTLKQIIAVKNRQFKPVRNEEIIDL